MADEDIARAIRQRDVTAVVNMMFEGNPPKPKIGFCTETNLWDFKGDCPRPGKEFATAWAEVAVDVLAFHNNVGGVIVFGIRDKDYTFCGASSRLDSKLINDQLRKFLSDRIWIEFYRHYIQADQRYLGIALVPPRGPVLERFQTSSLAMGGKVLFSGGDSAIRDNDSSRILRRSEADEYARKLAIPTLGKAYAVDDKFFRILSPDYERFVWREQPCKEIEVALTDRRAAVASLIGVGGTGKTALATWAALRAYDSKQFGFIASITAKDRELTPTGIQALEPSLTSFEGLLNTILDVLEFSELKSLGIEDKEANVRKLIADSNGLLYVDNLETVDDARIIQFLDSLPYGVRALTTSRRTSVRVSVHPITVGELNPSEVVEFIQTLAPQPGFGYVADLAESEREKIGVACDGLPLAIRWTLSRCQSAVEAVALADKITLSSKHGEELLEFCFRRVFDAMTGAEQAVLQVLSLFQRPIGAEVLLVTCRRVTITRLLASKLSWLLAAKSCSPSNSSPI